MKVNISYSVDLEEVLSSAFSLYKKEVASAEKAHEELQEKAGTTFEDDNLIEVLQAIKKYLDSSKRFNDKLLEINNILVGYAQIRYSQEQEGQKTPEPQREAKND
tara:strand:- start:2379 stop:2693 length:315 start_codon:yes stop_codon:yes gene_type:complete